MSDTKRRVVRRQILQERGEEPKRTKQADRKYTNIKAIVDKYRRTGQIDTPGVARQVYGDFTNVESYHELYNRVLNAQDAFEALPATVRTALDNDPAELIACVDDPERREEALELGLVEPTESEIAEADELEAEKRRQWEAARDGQQAVIPGTRPPAGEPQEKGAQGRPEPDQGDAQ